jgi:hypothetical protein
MPALALRFLPHLAMALALLGAIWWLDHQGYERARREAEARDLKLRTELQADLRQVEQALSRQFAAIDAATARTHAGIAQTRTVLQPTLVKELTRETRYADPDAGISDGLRAAIDRARAAVACAPAPDGGIVCTLPAAEPAQGQ